MSFTIGSLFDGSGGFPLAAFLCGGTPVWAAEIEPYPVAVTKARFPYMKHLGSVTDIKGNEIEPVDVITFGSPCQDLSVAGKRAGLKHTDNGDEETTRSGLFMEAVRIIKEMREATGGKYPRFALWENVPGAFSSSKGEDFRVVCEELIKIVEPSAVMPAVPKAGWAYADHFCGDGWSLAYRVLDAQYWGVPQRRRRLYLVLDLGGQCAGQVSFEREGLRGYFTEGRTPWQGIAGDVADRVGTADCEGADRVIAIDQQGGKGGANYAEDVMPTLCSDSHGTPHAVAYGVTSKGNGDAFISEERHTSLTSGGGQAGQGYPCVMCMATQQGGAEIMEDKCPTITAAAGMSGNNQPVVCHPEVVGVYKADDGSTGNASPTLVGDHNNRVTDHSALVVCVAYNGENITCPYNKTNPQPGDPCHTLGTDSRNYVVLPDVSLASGGKVTGCLMASGYEKLGAQEMFSGDYTVIEKHPIPIHDQATRFSGKRGDNHDGKGNGLGVGTPGDPANTLTSGDRHAVAYSLETFHCTSEEEKTTTLKARDYKDPCVVAYGVDCRNATEYEESMGSIQAAMNHNLNSNGVVRVQYIVRRLTPTECARLQGFADRWATPDTKTEFSDEEYKFWLNVRNTHAEINGKAVKSYTKDQMLNWYNKLHTDSAEYKLWGNGIALPTALYMMQGIAEVFRNE